MDDRQDWQAVVFAGGGCRCFWQLGFWQTAAPVLELRPRVVGAVSAGAAMACTVLADRIEAVVEDFKVRVTHNRRNIYPGNLLRGQPLCPHEAMYRAAILAALDEEALAGLHAGPEVRVLLTCPPRFWLPGPMAGWASLGLGFVAYLTDVVSGNRIHARWGRRVGFRPQIVSIRDCRTPEELADLILQSSCTPPALPLYCRDGHPVLDGGIVDNTPVEAVETRETRGSTLVLLTRHYPPERLPRIPGRTYVAPSEPIKVSVWDYTSPDKVQRTYDLGRRDGERFARATP